ncbi:VOC family protein [Streptomyces sp. TM32]|uniref:VOC family protein n=1 Tax=Streptomyces sp. TM32 TaxID=1652669 RepID=UPI001010F3AC|nr:VOC family protein [Streptomyces sp. TM32]RXS72705.1 VOC family protein [Streptomyces sp. TM32]
MSLLAEIITIDCAQPRVLADWWATVLGAEVAGDFGDYVLVGASPLALGFQRVPEELSGKNRLHVDFAAFDRDEEVAGLVRLGASVVGEHSVPGVLSWTVLRDPAGNEFCVSAGTHFPEKGVRPPG